MIGIRVVMLSLLFSLANELNAQIGWSWSVLPPMPEAVSNNAVSQGFSGDTLCIYSFTGIGGGLSPGDIHLKAWRYNTVLQTWKALPDVSDFRGKIAAAASTVENVVYTIGGYHVFDDFAEQTSGKVHRFDCSSNAWLTNGAEMPIPVDDHVQAVWRDSLIFTITGWSNTTNVSAVQVYNPALNTWAVADAVPSNSSFQAFGASGAIVADTIYYYGGVQITGTNFIANAKFRKGVINPNNPLEISWLQLSDAPLGQGYRMAATSSGNEVIWVGGSFIAYNFDALAYSDGLGVEPLDEIRTYNSESDSWSSFTPTPYALMDFRGIARESENSWILAGGMRANQVVSDQVYRIEREPATAKNLLKQRPLIISQGNALELKIESWKGATYSVFGSNGLLIKQSVFNEDHVFINLSDYSPGLYIIAIFEEAHQPYTIKFVNP